MVVVTVDAGRPRGAGREELIDVLRGLGLAVEATPDGIEVATGGGPTVLVHPRWRSVLSAGRAEDVVRSLPSLDAGLPLVIADKIPGPARAVLNAHGVGWLDRRGHVRIHGPGLLIDAEFPPSPEAEALPSYPSGRTGVGCATALLVAAAGAVDRPWETVAPTVTEVAELAGVAVSGASTASTFRRLGYLHGDGSPVVPDLFWATVEHWAPRWFGLARPIDSDARLVERLDAKLDDVDAIGWCLAGDAAAAAWNAPIVGGDVGARQWYVPSTEVLNTLRWILGEAAVGEPVADHVAVAPTPVLCRRRVDRGVGAPVEPLVGAALDLALDQARGTEALDTWEPDPGRGSGEVTSSAPDLIAIACRSDSTVARFIALVDGLGDDLKDELVLIGGLTVSCRLGFEHRVTNDVDGLYFNRSSDPLEQVLIGHDVPTDGHRVVLDDGTRLDVIEVGELDPTQLPDDESDRLFIESHRWAYDSATTVTICAVDRVTTTVHSTVTIRMAQAAALLPMKLRAAEARPRANEKKKASDSLDAYTLLDRLDVDGSLVAGVADAPWDIPDLTAAFLERAFIDNADVTAGRMHRWMNLAVPVAAEELRRVATRYLSF